MGGIVNYYHGEDGIVSEIHSQLNENRMIRCLELQGSLHRPFAFDYGGDILIDPRINRGDRVVFARLTPYDGVWVREQHFDIPHVIEAAKIASLERVRRQEIGTIAVRLPDIWADEAPDFAGITINGQVLFERPATEASFFISYSSKNVMLARSIVRDLRFDTKLDIWFDKEQESNTSDWPQQKAERWLREGVYSSKGFLLLLTNAAAKSAWVTKEFEWACNRSELDQQFRFIVLKLSDVPMPSGLPEEAIVIDGSGLWAINGIKEELLAAVFGREMRQIWKERNVNIADYQNPNFPEQLMSYSDYESTAGVAVSLKKSEDGWILEYEDDGRLVKIEQVQQTAIVDPRIRNGDQIASFICNRNKWVKFWPGYKYWMRSNDLDLEPEEVAAEFMTAIGDQPKPLRFTEDLG